MSRYWYPVISVLSGSFQVRITWVTVLLGVAVRPVGAAGGPRTALALAVLDAPLLPPSVTARIRSSTAGG